MGIIHIPFYPSDWLAGTRGLSDVETGVYITLIARMYEMAGPIERDDQRLFRLCGSKSKASFVKSLEYLKSEGKIIEAEDGLFNEKVAKVIEQTTEKSSKARAAAQSRWDRKSNKNNGSTNANASSKHMPKACQPEPEPYISPIGDMPPSDVIPISKQKRRKPELPLPDGWTPDMDKARNIMDAHDLTREEMNLCYQSMEAHAHANDRRQRDWDAAYRNWCISEIKYGNIGPKSRNRKQSSGGEQASIWD